MRYARPLDVFYMVLGTIAAFAHGAASPLFIYISGNVMNAFVNRAAYLCPLNLTMIAQRHCPANVELNSINFFLEIP